MISENQKIKIRMFLQDRVLSDTVESVIKNSFMKPRKNFDVHFLAASRLAIDFLNDAFEDLHRLSVEEAPLNKGFKNPAV